MPAYTCGCHLSFTSKFPDFPWYFSFLYPFKDPKVDFILNYNSAEWSLENGGLLSKVRICSPREQILSSERSPHLGGSSTWTISLEIIFCPLGQNKHIYLRMPEPLIFNFPDFKILTQSSLHEHKIPWLFLDLEKTPYRWSFQIMAILYNSLEP